MYALNRRSKSTSSISVLGSGTVGTIVGKGLLRLGNEMIFYDVDHGRIEHLLSLGFKATTDIETAIKYSDISFICVPTPTVRGRIDLSYVKSVTRKLATSLRKKDRYHLVVVKSTVLPTTAENIIIPLLETYSKRKVGEHIGVCSNPEFLTEVSRSWSNENEFSIGFFEEPFIVVGQFDKKSGDTLHGVYQSMKAPVIRTDLKTAEMIKYALNCMLACRISYWNEIFYICQKLGIDSTTVASVVGVDRRVGKYGTVHGKAFGGKCLPKDLSALIDFCKKLAYKPKLLEAVEQINSRIATEFGVRQ
jgi:UDPglucose 6-dehydrogenase